MEDEVIDSPVTFIGLASGTASYMHVNSVLFTFGV